MGLHDHIYSQGSERILLSGVSGTKPSKHFGNLDRQRLRERERERNVVQISKEDGEDLVK